MTYDIKLPDQNIGAAHTTTSHEWTNNETWAKIKAGDNGVGDGGIVFTSYDVGISLPDLERNPEFMANIYGVMAAVGGLAGGGPVKPELLAWEEYFTGNDEKSYRYVKRC